jgi:hypothetical protein
MQPVNLMLEPTAEMFDFWINTPTNMTPDMKAGFMTTQDWCRNGFFASRASTSLARVFTQHLVSDLGCRTPGLIAPEAGTTITGNLWCPTFDAQRRCQETVGILGLSVTPSAVRCQIKPQCNTFAGVYYCSEGLEYQNCLTWAHQAGYLDAAKHCGFDTSGEGTFLAQEIKVDLGRGFTGPGVQGPPSKYAGYCSIDGKVTEARAPAAGTHVMNGPANYSQNMVGVINGQGGAKGNGPGLISHMALPNMPRTSPVVLDCPRPALKHFCDASVQKYEAAAHLPLPIVSCTADHVDAAYQKLAAQVATYARNVANVHATYGPLVLTGTVAACPQGFTCVQSLTPTVDGVDTPTIVTEGMIPANVAKANQELDEITGKSALSCRTSFLRCSAPLYKSP